MLGEIDKDFYCSGLYFCDGRCEAGDDGECIQEDCEFCSYHRKYPTPEQFKEEYGKEYPYEGAVYCQHHNTNWFITYRENAEDAYKAGNCLMVCACTPFGKPPADWRPE